MAIEAKITHARGLSRPSGCEDLRCAKIRSLNHPARRSVRDLALLLVFLSLLSRVVLALVTDQTVPRLVASAALVAGQRLRHVKVRVRQVPLEGPRTRERLLTEATVCTADRATGVLHLLVQDLRPRRLAKLRPRLLRVPVLRQPAKIGERDRFVQRAPPLLLMHRLSVMAVAVVLLLTRLLTVVGIAAWQSICRLQIDLLVQQTRLELVDLW